MTEVLLMLTAIARVKELRLHRLLQTQGMKDSA